MKRRTVILQIALGACLLGVSAGCIPGSSNEAATAASEAAYAKKWEEKVTRALTTYHAATISDEAYLKREQARLIRAKDKMGLLKLMVGYARNTQKVALTAMQQVDAAGTPPEKARRMVGLLRRLLKMRIHGGRSFSHALANGDFDRYDRLVAQEAKDLPPLQRELVAEVKRVVPQLFDKKGIRP